MIRTCVYVFALVWLFFASGFNARSEDTLKTEEKSNSATKPKVIERKSPTGAVIRSLILPGWGQVYVKQYWKAPLFFSGAVVMYYYVFKHNNDYQKYASEYEDISKSNPNSIEAFILKAKRENSRDNRDISIFFLCGVYLLSAVDAYVNAHLYHFDVQENFSLRFSIERNYFALKISIPF